MSKDGCFVRQTIGQSSNTEIFNNSGFLLRQGFQQPILLGENPGIERTIDFRLSPNPARFKTQIEFNERINSYTIIISNINGETLEVLKEQTSISNWIELKNYKPGVYIITIVTRNYKCTVFGK